MKRLDALAIRKSWANPCFTGYEVKVSRSDFLRDNKFYTYEELVNCLYIVCPKDMISRTELPESVGLMYYYPDKKTLITKKKAIYRKIEYSPDMLRYIIYSRLDSDRIPFYSSKEEYFKEWLERKRELRYFGHQVGSALAKHCVELEEEIETIRRFKEAYDEYKKIIAVLRKHNIWGLGSTMPAELDKALSEGDTRDLKSIRMDLERVVARIVRMEEKANREAQEEGVVE